MRGLWWQPPTLSHLLTFLLHPPTQIEARVEAMSAWSLLAPRRWFRASITKEHGSLLSTIPHVGSKADRAFSMVAPEGSSRILVPGLEEPLGFWGTVCALL